MDRLLALKCCTGFLALAAAVGLLAPAQAETAPPVPSCPRPSQQTAFSSEHQLAFYRIEVANYAKCLQQFLDAHKTDAEKHKKAARAVKDSWKAYESQEVQF